MLHKVMTALLKYLGLKFLSCKGHS